MNYKVSIIKIKTQNKYLITRKLVILMLVCGQLQCPQDSDSEPKYS
jgi:hypothetical protein